MKRESDEAPSTSASTTSAPATVADAEVSELPTLPQNEEQSIKLVKLPQNEEPPTKIIKIETDNSVCKSSCALADLFGDVFVTKVEPAKSYVEKIRAEIISYKEEECLPLNSKVSDPLLWWQARQDKFPFLSKYAKRLLGVPATSVASERVFSTAGDVVTAQRACLSGDQVDMLVFLKHNIIIPADLNI